MERSLFKFIWRYSYVQQITTLILISASFPFLYFSLDLPKTIVNEAIGGDQFLYSLFQIDFFGFSFEGFQLTQLNYLFALCGIFLVLVCINGVFKLKINTYKGVMAERLLRRIRYILMERTLRFPLSQFKKTSSGEVVTMVTAEVEPLGGFFGDAFALLAFQGGTFLTIMIFMFVQDPLLGLAAFISIPLQGYVIPKLQKKVNALGKQRVKLVRSLSGRINEVIDGVEDIHAQDNTKFILAELTKRLGDIFWVRFEIYKRKFFMKFLNNFIGQMTPFFFYAVGGYLVIQGDLTFGALVAALAAYKDLSAPWKELLNYYQRMADSKIKYDQIQSQFVPEGMMDEKIIHDFPTQELILNDEISVAGVSYEMEDVCLIENATFTVPQNQLTLITANNSASREALARMLARLELPRKGTIHYGRMNAQTIHEYTISKNVAYLSNQPTFFDSSLEDNLFMGLNNNPTPYNASEQKEYAQELEEAFASGNSPYLTSRKWPRYNKEGDDRVEALHHQAVLLLEKADMTKDLFNIGLKQTISSQAAPELTQQILKARRTLGPLLEERGYTDLVRAFDEDSYNEYTTVYENIIFGRPIDPRFEPQNIMAQPEIIKLFKAHRLYDLFMRVGLRGAEIMVDMFKDVTPGHAIFEQFSFVDEETLPMLKEIVAQSRKKDIREFPDDVKQILLSLPLKLIPQRHRLGLIDNRIRAKIINLRRDLHNFYPEIFKTGIQPFNQENYNDTLTIQDNILFGTIAYGRADAPERIESILIELTQNLNLYEMIIRTAFNFRVGLNGNRLNLAQKQKLSLVRNLLKEPKIILVNDGFSALDQTTLAKFYHEFEILQHDTTIIWLCSQIPNDLKYHQHLEIHNTRVISSEHKEIELAKTRGKGAQSMGGEAMVLKNLPLFTELDSSQLKLLAFTADRKHYLPGEELFKQGDDGDTAFVILDGEADVILENEDGDETILFPVGRNQLVGELALLCDTKRTATIRVTEEMNVLQLNSDVFAELARQDANFSYQLTRDLSQRLVDTTAELNKQ